MAKKKNAPVLRDGDNNQPTITKSYAVRDKWLDKAKDNLVEFKSVDGEISDLKVNGEPAGGGGGDFSTAQVTIDNSNNQGQYPPIYGSIVGSYNTGGFPPTLADCTEGRIAPSDPIQTYTVILYKGKAKLSVNVSGAQTITVSGNAIDVGDNAYVFSGNGTITIS